MNQEILVGMVGGAQIAMFAAMTAIPILKSRIFKCPNCGKHISRKHISLTKIDCPKCDWSLVPDVTDVSQMEPASSVPDICNLCNEPLDNSEYAELWDEKFYCRNCFCEQSPDLWRYALDNETLAEKFDFSPWKYFGRMFLFLNSVLLGLVGTIGFFGGLSEGGLWTAIQYLAVCQLCVAPFVIVFAGAHTLGFRSFLPTVKVEGGRLSVRYGHGKSLRHPLEQVEWFIGNRSKMVLGEKIMVPGGPAILIALPPESDEFQKFVAVGHDDRMREIWSTFLTLAAIPRRKDLEVKRSVISSIGHFVAILAFIPIALFGSCLVFSLAGVVVQLITGIPGVARLIGNQFGFPGFFYFAIYAIVFWPGGVFSKPKVCRSDESRKKLYRKVFWGMSLTFSLAIFYCLLDRQAAISTRIIGATFALSHILLFSHDYARRASWRL